MKHKIKRLKREKVYEGSVFNFYQDTMRLPDGKIETWDFVAHKRVGGAATVPVLPDGRILLIRQYRPAVDRDTLELPAGARDSSGEDPILTAARELEEETGYSSREVTPLISLKTATSWSNEETDVYLALNCKKKGEQTLDEAEEIQVEAYPLEELLNRIYSGELQDAKTVAGILAYYGRVRKEETDVHS